MKNLIKSLILLSVIAIIALAFNFNDNQSNTAINPEPPGFRVTVLGSNGYFTITCDQGGEPRGTCYTGSGWVCNINLSGYGAGNYNLYADNGSCKGELLNVYWNGSGTTAVTIDVRAECYK
jgi:hypothetical protein